MRVQSSSIDFKEKSLGHILNIDHNEELQYRIHYLIELKKIVIFVLARYEKSYTINRIL